MEETNYSRNIIVGQEVKPDSVEAPRQSLPESEDEKKGSAVADDEPEELSPPRKAKQKTYLDKIKLWQAADVNKPNHLAGMVARPLVFLTFPVNL